MLALFCMAAIINNGTWIVQAPIFDLEIALYGTSIYMINFLSASYMIFYAPLNFPSVAALDKYGLKTGVVIGMVGTTIGCWLKCLVNSSFFFVVIG